MTARAIALAVSRPITRQFLTKGAIDLQHKILVHG